jgi:hypothetical protein
MKIEIRAYSRTEAWFKTDYFCPICGKKEVWSEAGPGDYYAGPRILCVECGGSMEHPQGASVHQTDTDKDRIKQIKERA